MLGPATNRSANEPEGFGDGVAIRKMNRAMTPVADPQRKDNTPVR